MANDVHPDAVTPHSAGSDLTQSIEDAISQHHKEATQHYSALQAIESDPVNQYEVQTGTKEVPTGALDDAGKPLTKTVPVTETMGLPVDLRDAKAALRPLRDKMMRQLPVTQQQASIGLKALNNIVDGPDFAPASQTDADLGAIKELARNDDMSELKSKSQTLASQAVAELEQSVQRAVSRARKASPETSAPEATAAVGTPNQTLPLRASSINNSLARDTEAPVPTADTTVKVPGQKQGYAAQYALKELSDLQASHNAQTFDPNQKYEFMNDRDYANPVNQAKIVEGSTKAGFDPSYLINDNPDASNGAPVVDSKGNVLGGNGRVMILNRVHADNPEGIVAYQDLLRQKAGQFGLDPAEVAKMKQPILTRVVEDKALTNPQQAIADFNKKGTADLTRSEKAIADSKRVSTTTQSQISELLDSQTGKSLSEALEGKAGANVLNALVKDGAIDASERASLQGSSGELTKAGKQRISDLVIGRFFSDPAQLDSLPAVIRTRLERISAPLARVENYGDWSLTQHVKDAMNLIDGARARGNYLADNLKQQDLFGSEGPTPQAVSLAEKLQTTSSKDLAAAAKQYAGEADYANQGGSLFGNAPKPSDSFAKTFGEAKASTETPVAAAEAPSPAPARRYELPPLNKGVNIGQEAAAILRAGRDSTISKYKAAAIRDSLPGKGEEGVKVFDRLTAPKDTHIEQLRDLKEVSPQAIPKIGRAYIEQMFDLATADGGFNRADAMFRKWQMLGKQTRQLLFGSEKQVKDLDNFFTGFKKLEEVNKGSQTAPLSTITALMEGIVFNPAFTLVHQGVSSAISAAMYNPKFVRLMSEGLKVPAETPHGKLLAKEILKMAGATGAASAAGFNSNSKQ
jgi:hypothetical protein